MIHNKHEWSGVVYEGGAKKEGFKEMIETILNRANLKEKYISDLLSPENLSKFDKAFTSKSAFPNVWKLQNDIQDKEKCGIDTDLEKEQLKMELKKAEHNYEIYEQLGDLTINKFIVWYAYRRFPQLECSMGVKVVARLRINYGSRAKFAEIGNSLGFWPYITADEVERNNKMKDLLEDVLEAFIGCVEQILDNKYRPGVGYAIAHDILASIFDEMNISLKYDDLYDAKTRLKELFDHCTKKYTWRFTEVKVDLLVTSSVWKIPINTSKDIITPQGDWELIGTGTASKKSDAQQDAAKNALKKLQKTWSRPLKDEYLYFSN